MSPRILDTCDLDLPLGELPEKLQALVHQATDQDVYGEWAGRLSYRLQRALFGRVIFGKSKIVVSALHETVTVFWAAPHGGSREEVFRWEYLSEVEDLKVS